MNYISRKLFSTHSLFAVIFSMIALFPVISFASGTSILVLVNSSTNKDIKRLGNPEVIDLSKVGNALNIRTESQIDGIEPYKVEFYINGAYVRTENDAPFSLAGDNRGNYNNWNPKPGDYTIRTRQYFSNTTYVWDNSRTVRVVNKYVDYNGAYFTLVNADTNRDLFEIDKNDTISLSKYGNALNIRVDFLGGYSPDSVTFNLNNGSFVNEEKAAPFAMAGDNNGNYRTWKPKPGNYTLSVAARDANYGNHFSLSFKIVK